MTAEPSSQFNIHEAKTHFSRIVERVERGEEIVISRAGEPVAKLVPIVRRVNRTSRGSLKGRLILRNDWDSAESNEQMARDFGLLG